MAGTFQVLWGQAGGSFKKAAELNGVDGKPLIIPSKSEQDIIESICTRPSAVDWDGDGDLDLVVGNFAGKFYLFTGEGRGKFAPKPQPLMAGDKPLILAGEHPAHGDPFPIDWDNDGDLDLLSGAAEGGVQWAENTAGAKLTPVLKPFVRLIEPGRQPECRPNEIAAPADSTRVWAADVSGDGKLDILIGDNITLISPGTGVSDSDFTRRYAEWKAAYDAAQKETEGITDEAKLAPIYEKIGKLHEQRKEFLSADRTGFVWLYVQK